MNPLAGSRDSRHTSKCSHIHIVKTKQATTSLYQKHPKAWEQNRCYSRYMLFLDTTRYSQLQPGSMQHPVVIPQSKSRWGGTTSYLDVSWAPLPATSGRTDRKSQISLCKTPPGLSSLPVSIWTSGGFSDAACKLAKHMSKTAPGLSNRSFLLIRDAQETPALPLSSYVIFLEAKLPELQALYHTLWHHNVKSQQTSCGRTCLVYPKYPKPWSLQQDLTKTGRKPWETTQYPHGHSIQGIRTKEVLVGTKCVNSKSCWGNNSGFHGTLCSASVSKGSRHFIIHQTHQRESSKSMSLSEKLQWTPWQ